MRASTEIKKETPLYNSDKRHACPILEIENPKRNDTFTGERMQAIYEKILYVLENKKIYLDAHINLTKLSLLLCTNTTYLSKVINNHFKCNLKTLLNRYRIAHAKELLTKEKCNMQNLPAQCGFISRSTFYAAFTKFEHITPSDFRARHQSLELLKEIETNIHRLSTL